MSEKRKVATEHIVSGHFWAEFLAELDCLGRKFESEIAGHPVEIVIPGRDPNPETRPLLPPAVSATKDEKPERSDARFPVWGKLTNWMECTFGVRFAGHDEVEMAKISRIGISTTLKTNDIQTSQTYTRLVDEIDDWWSCAQLWLQIFAASRVKTLRPLHQADQGVGLTLWDGNARLEGKSGPIGYPELFSVPVTADELTASLRLAGRGQEPPMEWALIRDAQHLVRAHQYRRAIIDAGTAAELAITRMIDRKLRSQGQSSTQIEALLAQRAHQTIGRRMDLLKKVRGGALPPKFYEIVVKQRNAAAHEGKQFQRIEAERAVLKVRRLVEKVVKLEAYL
ncbi:hypothetical protein [Mycobacteroides abscessus]|uniref:Apea-like HEPN domain-containing protein n=1 Tax=Mycobacteroides abscessus TaxID=36809 RepID=A0A0U0ZNB5_9MYCO|nr:hypothetical protein [Mycobacteroides abscessus]SKS57544.1 Uncharacterised protein [Mycobacteroides abscessus subsp. abscessus]MBL3734186.1 hypothetical protein [Mycobacteroides abscessus subsp. massiliense]MBL3763316.1 hypothetical protein [Mycobacteroides abscessus subsp. massiliense]MBN7481786.1 hypothetical protein [Mycobacteroides abscessus subsp. massiliense]MDB2216567.1 hypothetical protein [Mycobacteroides abscessus subsp. massiliense]